MILLGKPHAPDPADAPTEGRPIAAAFLHHPAPRAETRVEADARLEGELRQALERGQLTLHYQPRVSLATRATVGAEALARWPHRKRGMVPPGVFIPLAERLGLISSLGGWALVAACREAAGWPVPVSVSVNVSARQLADKVLLRQVRTALEETGLAPARLEIELTESMVIDAGIETLLTLSAIRDLGVGIALDDFGTGYASLAMLKRLPLTVMKLDRLLVRGVPRYREDTAIVRAAVETGHALGLAVVAEGIDSDAQSAALATLGCEEGQAYLFGRPMPAGRFRERLGGGE